jgi:hypothetical protein
MPWHSSCAVIHSKWISMITHSVEGWATAELAKQLTMSAFRSLSKFICRCSTINGIFFGSSYLCEEAFTHMNIIQLRNRSHLINDHLTCCHHLCLSNNKPSFRKLSQDVRCHASTSTNRKVNEKHLEIMVNFLFWNNQFLINETNVHVYIFTLLCHFIYFFPSWPILTLNLLTWRIWWAPNNASKWQMGFNSAFKGLTQYVLW